MRKRERGDGRIFQQVYRVSKAGAVLPPGAPTGEWIEDPVSKDFVTVQVSEPLGPLERGGTKCCGRAEGHAVHVGV